MCLLRRGLLYYLAGRVKALSLGWLIPRTGMHEPTHTHISLPHTTSTKILYQSTVTVIACYIFWLCNSSVLIDWLQKQRYIFKRATHCDMIRFWPLTLPCRFQDSVHASVQCPTLLTADCYPCLQWRDGVWGRKYKPVWETEGEDSVLCYFQIQLMTPPPFHRDKWYEVRPRGCPKLL